MWRRRPCGRRSRRRYSRSMILFEHPIWRYLRPYAHLAEGRDNLDILQLPDQLRTLALEHVWANCVSCGAAIHPLRARALSERSRVAHTAIERRLFYAPTCPTEKDPGCSRTKAAQRHKDDVREMFGLERRHDEEVEESSANSTAIETLDGLCLQEPWLELILLGVKTLETRTKCLRKKGGSVVLTSSKTFDVGAWSDPVVGGLLDDDAKKRALAGLGKMRGQVLFGDCRAGIPEVDDAAACIPIRLPSGRPRFVFPIHMVMRVLEVPTVRVRPSGATAMGASQGFFKVPKSAVVLP